MTRFRLLAFLFLGAMILMPALAQSAVIRKAPPRPGPSRAAPNTTSALHRSIVPLTRPVRARGLDHRSTITIHLPVRPVDPKTSPPAHNTVPFEVRWLQAMVMQNKRMAALARTEAEKTTSTQIKTFCADLQTSLALELAQMQTWLKDWYGIQPVSETVSGVPAPRDPVSIALRNPDLVFLNQVICYGRTVHVACGFPAVAATHAELKPFAIKLAAEAKNIIELVQSWQLLLIKINLESSLRP